MPIDGWRIDPATARAAVAGARTEAEGFGQLEVGLVGALQSASTATSGKAPSTTSSLERILTDPFELDLAAVAQRLSAAVEATEAAIAAYEAGDAEMGTRSDGAVEPR
ncbi:DUF6507 family protein [Frigoribacterium sp. VKM Ac-2530]|jgi:hypothetical protein|uniref:DUF6507 family protein n=1 Tax=Frigoribacterium sp. VKM Ac-2530 TaxID=2783822 RepID=UPI00188A3EF1|nr:DUF6507 family protein [Frigoribacterium sp. VKM Ac-2530]MBF4580545.1 hypothetical protein [Frigoribacterium sp. VKM Ac-2530]